MLDISTILEPFATLPAPRAAALANACAASEYLQQRCANDPALAAVWHDERPLAAVVHSLQAHFTSATPSTEAEALSALRHRRHQLHATVALYDIAGWASVDEVLRVISSISRSLIETALTWAETTVAERFGQLLDEQGQAQRLYVLGMGKLGGNELNFSSDIDLIFGYCNHSAGNRLLSNGRKAVSPQEYFLRVAQQLTRLLDMRTADGFVYRVDTRLRPFGRDGALVISSDAMHSYYETHGRDWERYALIKADVVAGDIAAGHRLLADLNPFIYRRYLDFSVFAGLRDMKAMIERELKIKGLDDHIKLGPGGIREVEFIVQTMQLVRGGQEPELQGQSIYRLFDCLPQHSELGAATCEQLRASYNFLRVVENRLQQWRDEQTHELPSADNATAWQRIATSITDANGIALDEGQFKAILTEHRRTVRACFDEVFDTEEKPAANDWKLLNTEALVEQGFSEATATYLLRLGDDRYPYLGAAAKDGWDRLLPVLIDEAAALDQPDLALRRSLGVVEAIAGRATYIALLNERPAARQLLLTLCGASPWIAQELARHPITLDELLDRRELLEIAGAGDLAEQLTRMLASASGDEEEQVQRLRQFRHSHVLKVAAVDLLGELPLMKVSDHLTHIAEACLVGAQDVAWEPLVARHGEPIRNDDACAGLAVVGYGKLGGIELGYSSDLDLVFLHNGDSRPTTGERSVDQQVFFTRLVQRMTHVLMANTSLGRAYEVDTRLRPSGNSGLAVSSMTAFAKYQMDKAWTWEHQALVRARAVAGCDKAQAEFAQIRGEILAQPREPQALGEAIIEMRDKMRGSLDRSDATQFDLKQGAGGIADIEFMVQYAVLRWASSHAELTEYPDNIRILEQLGEVGLKSAKLTADLIEAYQAIRWRGHRLALQESPALVANTELAAERDLVKSAWQQWFGA